jgi:pheromone shutdown protein TraB
MASRLQEILDHTTGPVIAVVGLGHVDGIMRHLDVNREASGPFSVGVRYEWTLGTSP